jgi:3'-phosphoadenosine 5'-phosphosulfate sulfotransferase (PAPS reductase)/FAD synthetase
MNSIFDLRSYDWIVINSSAGKDSQAMLDYVTHLARIAGVEDRIIVVHADLGRVEWKGTKELFETQAAHYGHKTVVVSRIGGVSPGRGKSRHFRPLDGREDALTYEAGEEYGDILDYVARRGKWPDAANRWCTADFKTAPVRKLLPALAKQTRTETGKKQPRILNCLGMRAQESPKRKKMLAFETEKEATTGAKHVDRWLPIHDWTVEQVWARIKESGVPHHEAYDLGMPRLSCVFCVMATGQKGAALKVAGKHNPELLADYVAVERLTGHRFTMALSLEEIQADLAANPDTPDTVEDWAA